MSRLTSASLCLLRDPSHFELELICITHPGLYIFSFPFTIFIAQGRCFRVFFNPRVLVALGPGLKEPVTKLPPESCFEASPFSLWAESSGPSHVPSHIPSTAGSLLG